MIKLSKWTLYICMHMCTSVYTYAYIYMVSRAYIYVTSKIHAILNYKKEYIYMWIHRYTVVYK